MHVQRTLTELMTNIVASRFKAAYARQFLDPFEPFCRFVRIHWS